ncbi:MAG: hypothetical protein ACRDRG_10990 [Pseudonocardiaceae bacterium]
MDETTWQHTAETVRAAFADGDLAGLAPLLARDVRWHGAGPGGCHSAAEVLNAELMLAETEEPVDAARQGVLFYLYSSDLVGLRAHLRANGAAPSDIADGSPGPREEMRVDDPDVTAS